MAGKLEAHFENRVYYFIVVNKGNEEISINMYGTPYTFLKKDQGWLNHPGNKMNMVQGLINAVIETVKS